MSRRSSPRWIGAALCAATALLALVAAVAAETIQEGNLRVSVKGGISPRKLPRQGTAPVAVDFSGRISTTNGSSPPQLRRIEIGINRHGRLASRGLPVCRPAEIQPSTTDDALKICGRALVGEGRFSANVLLPEQAPFPSSGKVLAFNARIGGRPAILAHVYGSEPVPTSHVLPFEIRRARGTFATVLSASLPQVTSDWGYVTGLSMTLHRTYRYRGVRRTYLAAGCPAPQGFPGAVFPLVRAEFSFAGGRTIESVLTRSCGVRG